MAVITKHRTITPPIIASLLLRKNLTEASNLDLKVEIDFSGDSTQSYLGINDYVQYICNQICDYDDNCEHNCGAKYSGIVLGR